MRRVRAAYSADIAQIISTAGRTDGHHQTGNHPIDRERVRVGDVLLDRVSYDAIKQRLSDYVRDGTPRQVVTVNLQFLGMAARNPESRDVLNNANLAIADDTPVVWVSKLLGTPIADRVTGHDIMDFSAQISAQHGHKLFFLGAAPGVAETAADRLRERYPGINIVGIHGGMYTTEGYGRTEEDERSAIEAIRAAKPDFLFVGLGAPKQDFWIRNHLHGVNVPVSVADKIVRGSSVPVLLIPQAATRHDA